MKRRDFLAASAVLSLLAASPARAVNKPGQKPPSRPAAKPAAKPVGKPPAKPAAPPRHPSMPPPPPGEIPVVASVPEEAPPLWRNYEVNWALALRPGRGPVKIWLPLPQYRDSNWQRALGHRWQGNFDAAGIQRDPLSQTEIFHAEWKDGNATPRLEITSQVATQDRHFDITRRGIAAERNEVLRACLRGSERIPTGEPLRSIADRAVGRVRDPVAQGKAIYDWVVEHSKYDPSGPGVGNGDVLALFDRGQFHGGSADIALLFVGLCRAFGIPARPVFGMRIDGSRLFSSLGASGNLKDALHCRAEFYAPGYGWIPVDPADVRKAIAVESLGPADSKLTVLRKLLFGFWEMNWIGLNAAEDIALQGSGRSPLPFLIQPQIETTEGRFGALDAQRVDYQVGAQRIDL